MSRMEEGDIRVAQVVALHPRVRGIRYDDPEYQGAMSRYHRAVVRLHPAEEKLADIVAKDLKRHANPYNRAVIRTIGSEPVEEYKRRIMALAEDYVQ